MKKLLLFFTAIVCGIAAQAQCTASMTYTQTPGTYTVQFANTSTVAGATNPASIYRHIYIYPDSTPNYWMSAAHIYTTSGSYTFPGPGVYLIATTVNSAAPNPLCVDSTATLITVQPSACFSTIAMTGTGATRTFTATTPANTAGMAYSWSIYGMGSTVTLSGSSVNYTFPSSGVYSVTLTATGGGCTDTAMIAPLSLSLPLNCATVSNNISLNSSGATVNAIPQVTPGSMLVQHTWNWGDGSPAQTIPHWNSNWGTQHTYTAAGSYTISLVTMWHDTLNSVTCFDTATQVYNFNPPACAFYITGTGAGSTRTYTAHSYTNATNVNYTWSFGDGSTATGNPVTHTFAYGGVYSVSASSSISSPACNDSAGVIDTVQGPLNCAQTSNSIYVWTGTGLTKQFSGYANSNFGTPGYSYSHEWSFGNGATGTGSSVSYTYPSAGTYTVRLITVWFATSNPSVIVCRDTSYATVTASLSGFTCATANVSFTTSVSGLGVYLYPTYTPTSLPSGVTVQNTIYWGDGNTQNINYQFGGTYHGYAASGTYTAKLVTRWYQGASLLCADSFQQALTVAQLNVIFGHVQVDSPQIYPAYPPDSIKVWLITYDANTNMLTAVDSVVTGGGWYSPFQFSGKPAGVYRTKAHLMYQPVASTGYVPTYRDSALTWNTAQTFPHTSGTTNCGIIWMRDGLVTSGPGFVGGNVLQGANKGTADGDPVAGQLLFLQDAASNQLVASAYTNAQGSYSFNNIPVGSYVVYPEEINYATTPSAIITVSASQSSVSGVNFRKDDVSLTLKPSTVTGLRGLTASSFRMAPNPATASLTIDFGRTAGTADVRVLNVAGQAVHTLRHSATSPAVLDVSALPAGVYSVQVSTASGTATEKLVIIR